MARHGRRADWTALAPEEEYEEYQEDDRSVVVNMEGRPRTAHTLGLAAG